MSAPKERGCVRHPVRGVFKHDFEPMLDGRRTFHSFRDHPERPRVEPGDVVDFIEIELCEACDGAKCEGCKGIGYTRTGFEISGVVRYIVRGPELELPPGRTVFSFEVISKVTSGFTPGRCEARA